MNSIFIILIPSQLSQRVPSLEGRVLSNKTNKYGATSFRSVQIIFLTLTLIYWYLCKIHRTHH